MDTSTQNIRHTSGRHQLHPSETEKTKSVERQKRLFPYALGLLLQLHFFGLLGMHWPLMDEWLQKLTPFPSFLSLTPLNLVLTACLLFLFHTDWNRAFWLFFTVAFTVGFGIEVAGVHTGVIFGEYSYGEVLGVKLFEVPILIGVNWLVLGYATGVVAHRLTTSWKIASLLSAAMMTFLDWLIEPVAIELGFWTWATTDVPLLNYFAWFIISFLICAVFHRLQFAKQNRMAAWVLGIQVVFFIAQQFLLAV